jgi:hypothetical protein
VRIWQSMMDSLKGRPTRLSMSYGVGTKAMNHGLTTLVELLIVWLS